MANHIRGIRQGIPGATILGRKAGTRGAVGLIPLGNGAGATSTAGGFVPQLQQSGGFTQFNNAGVWSSTSAYNPGDVVTYNGGAYVNYVAVSAPGPNPSPDVDDAHWFSQGAVNTVDANFVISTGQLQFAAIASGDVLGNSGAGTAEPTAATLTAMIDRAFGSTEGQILQRGASAWQILAPGSIGQFLVSGGAGALNSWDPRLTDSGTILTYNINALSSPSLPSTFSTTPGLQFIGADGSAARFGFATYGAAGGFNFARADGTGASPSQVVANDVILQLGALGYTSTPGWSAANRGLLRMTASENWTGSANGMQLTLSATATGTLTTATVAQFGPSGWQVFNAGTAPTGGDKGGGTINVATAYYTAGVLNGTQGFIVAALPAAPGTGARAYVTDATAPTFLGALTGGGTVTCPVFYNGTAWVAG